MHFIKLESNAACCNTLSCACAMPCCAVLRCAALALRYADTPVIELPSAYQLAAAMPAAIEGTHSRHAR